jgi:predicted DNA-binding transcriptional regulator AlpA
MSIHIKPEPVVTIAEMCNRLSMSRSNLFWHLQKGTFHRPRKLANGRSFFTAHQAAENESVKKTGIGINGEYVLFYERHTHHSKTSNKTTERYAEVISLLQELGLSGLTASQIKSAISDSFTSTPKDLTASPVLRTLFQYLSCPKDV